MPTLAELLLALITNAPLSHDEKREIARHILVLARRCHEDHHRIVPEASAPEP